MADDGCPLGQFTDDLIEELVITPEGEEALQDSDLAELANLVRWLKVGGVEGIWHIARNPVDGQLTAERITKREVIAALKTEAGS